MPKVGIVIITYNQPDLLPRQLDCLQRFCKDEYKVLVVDNSTVLEARTAIKYHARNCSYIRSKASATNGSESHAFAANLSYIKYKDDFDYLFWLDHDCFPFAQFSVAEILNGKSRIQRNKIPPTAERGIAVYTIIASLIEPKAKCNKIKIKNKAIGTAINSLAFALSKFSNCPPYVTR